MKSYERIEKRSPHNDNGPCKRSKDHDLRICTWNVRSLYRDGAKNELLKVVKEYKTDIIALQEMRLLGHGSEKHSNCDIYYSGHAKDHIFGCGFAVGKRLRHLVSKFTPISERIATIRIKAKFFNITIICAHAPTNKKDDATKDDFYERLEEVYDRCPGHDIKIVLGDFNAKIGRENVFSPTVGRFSIHEDTTTDNAIRLIDFAAARNMVISSTRFQHLDIHKATWKHPNKKVFNQIDHVLIDGRHASSVLDVKSIRGAYIDSDHYLVAAKVRTRLCAAYNIRSNSQRKFDISKLKTQQIATNFSTQLSQILQTTPQLDDIGAQWMHISQSMTEAAERVLGYQGRKSKNPWYDDECKQASEDKRAAYKASLQKTGIHAIDEAAAKLYKDKRRAEKRLFKRKKRELEIIECERIEMSRDRNDTRKFFEKIKQMSGGSKTRASHCKDESGNLVTDKQESLKIWRDHFSRLLNDDNGLAADNISDPPFNEDDIQVPPPNIVEIRTIVNRLKDNKAVGEDSLPAELFKSGGEVLVEHMYHLIRCIWLEECMPHDWSNSVVCPILKKGDPTACSNYRGISLLPIAYKLLSGVLCEKLKPIVDPQIGAYQCGFRPGRSTIDQIFALRQVLQKTREQQIGTHHLFVDFKAAFDSPSRHSLLVAMGMLGIPAKLIRLCEMTLTNTRSSVKIGKDISEPFSTERGFRQGDQLSCVLFNILLDRVIRNAFTDEIPNGVIYSKSTMLLAYADDIDIIGRTLEDVKRAFTKIEREASKMGLAINADKTKLMQAVFRKSLCVDKSVKVGNFEFEVVDDFIYLGSLVNNKNNVSMEIKRRITLANRCYFGLSKQMRSRNISRATKITLYKSLILPVLTYGAEAWVMSTADEKMLGVFERKILRKIFGPVREGGEFRRRLNDELYQIYKQNDIVRQLKIQRLRWAGHVQRMDISSPARKALTEEPYGQPGRGRPALRWNEQVEKDAWSILKVRDWRSRAKDDKDGWRLLLQQATDLHRL